MRFDKILINWYNKNKRTLPWRDTKDPYRIWLSEIILQQTRVEQGLPYYLKFVEAYPTVFKLADAPEEEVLKLWQGLGYYSRARNLHTTAKEVAFNLHGTFPNTHKELIQLKGIGDYTASAIASICFGEKTAVVDGNVYRVLARYFSVDMPVNSSKAGKYFKKLAQELISEEDPATFNQAIMEFGAKQCKPQNPDCSICPFNTSCLSLKNGKVKELPLKIRKSPVKKRFFNYLVITDKHHVMLQQRTKKDIWHSLYEFPLIETEKEVSKETLVNHTVFKNAVKDNAYELLMYNRDFIIHKLSHQHLYTRFWILNVKTALNSGVPNARVKDYALPVLIANFVNEYGF